MRLTIFFLIILLAIPFSPQALAEETALSAGFVNTLWYSQNEWYVNDHVRVYAGLQNQSPYDLVGTLHLYDNDKLINEASFSIAKGTLIHHWFDVKVTTGTHKLYETITKTYQSEAGKTLGSVSVRFPTSSIAYKTALIKNTSTASLKNTPETFLSSTSTAISTSSIPTSSRIITVSSDQPDSLSSSTSESSAPSSSFKENGSTSPSGLSNTVGTAKNIISKLTQGITTELTNKKQILDSELQQEKNHQPLDLLEKSAKQIENKTTFLKIPREKIPSLKQLQSWSLGLTILILKTWWIMLILFALLIWNIWRLWRYIHHKTEYY